MERCAWCSGTLDPATHRCQQCGRLPEDRPAQTLAMGPDTSFLQLGLGQGTHYLDLDLEIGQGQQGIYPLLVLRSPAGAATGQLRWPFAVSEFQQTLLELQIALLRASQPHRRVISPEAQTIQHFGQRLFEALLTGEVRRCYALSQQMAAAQGKGLRLRLHLLAPDLALVPWEYLYDPQQGDYLCLSRTTPIVRYLERQEPRQPLPIAFPLRILGMITSPSDQEALDTQGEQQRVEAALRRLRERGLVELVWLKGHTWRDLQRAMRGGPWHIFHFIGHGGFDPQADEGVLALETEEGTTQLLRATELARLLVTQQALRLVLLNACEGARASLHDRFSSTAATLARRDIPAVVAMQYAITDRAATEWTRTFYEAVADGLPMDAAVAEARTAISLAIPHTLEWGTPVLYLQAPDGVLFRLPGGSRQLLALPTKTREWGLAETPAAPHAGQSQEALADSDQALTLASHDPASPQGTADVLPALQEAATNEAAPAPTPLAPGAASPAAPVPPPAPPQITPLPQASTALPGQGILQPQTLPAAPPPVQDAPGEQATIRLPELVAPGLVSAGPDGPAAQAAHGPRGAVAPHQPTMASPARKRHTGRLVAALFLLVIVVVGGSGAALGFTGNGPLAFLDSHASSPGSTATSRSGPKAIITEFPLPTPDAHPWSIAAGPDGNLWFTEGGGNKIGRITPQGAISEFPLPTRGPFGIAAGPDGNLWFTSCSFIDVCSEGEIRRITPQGTITEFPLPFSTTPTNIIALPNIAAGPDGNLWFTDCSFSGSACSGGKIGRITPQGTITEFPFPDTSNSAPLGIAAGPDGNLWFTEASGIGRITPQGTIIEFPTNGGGPYCIAAGPDGNLWFTGRDGSGSGIGRITPQGTITEFSIPTGNTPIGIAAGPDGNLWFVENSGNKIVRIPSGR